MCIREGKKIKVYKANIHRESDSVRITEMHIAYSCKTNTNNSYIKLCNTCLNMVLVPDPSYPTKKNF